MGAVAVVGEVEGLAAGASPAPLELEGAVVVLGGAGEPDASRASRALSAIALQSRSATSFPGQY